MILRISSRAAAVASILVTLGVIPFLSDWGVPSGGGTGGAGTGGSGGSAATGPYVTRDENGWTVVATSPDSRVVYVSSSDGNDSDDGLSEINAKATIAAGRALLRDGYPDHLLLKAGDRWEESVMNWELSGRSADEPVVVASYGSGDRPSFKNITRNQTDTPPFSSHAYFLDLDLYIAERDPDSPSFDLEFVSTDITNAVRWNFCDSGGTDFLFENIRTRYAARGFSMITIDSTPTVNLSDMRIRRCVILDSYCVPAHSQGIYASNVDQLLIEETVFDHNGWTGTVVDGVWSGPIADTEPNQFNHTLYLNELNDAVVRRNVSIRPSSQHVKFRNDYVGKSDGITVSENLLLGGEIGVGIGGNIDGTADRFRNVLVDQNVVMYLGRDITRNIGWGIDISDITTGTVSNNLVARLTDRSGSHGILLSYTAAGLSVDSNTIYNVNEVMLWLKTTGGSNITITNNLFQSPVDTPEEVTSEIVDYRTGLGEFTMSGNTYYTDTPSVLAKNNGAELTLAGWVAFASETSSSFSQVSFTDPTRTPETWDTSQGGDGTYAHFIATVRAQSKTNWTYTAAAINAYIRAGFAY